MSLYPVYDITRNSIQQSIYELQQKIRKRKQIQEELQSEIILMNQKLNSEMNHLHRYEKNHIDYFQIRLAENLAKIQNQRAIKQIYPSSSAFKNNYKNSHISPIQQINQRTYQNSFQYDEPLSQDESQLVYKYYNGIKASQYFKDLQRLQYNKNILDQQHLINIKRLNNIDKQKAFLNNQQKFSQSIKKYITPEKQKSLSNQKNTKKKQNNNFLNGYDNDYVKQGVQTISNTASKYQDQSHKKIHKKQGYQPNKILNLILNQRHSNSKIQNSQSPYKNFKESPLKTFDQGFTKKLKQSNQRQELFVNEAHSKRNKKHRKKIYGHTIHVDKANVTFKQRQLQRSYNCDNRKRSKSSRAKSQSKCKNQKSKRSVANYSQDKIFIPAPVFPNCQTIDHEQFFFEKIKKLCNNKIQKRLVLSQVIYKDSKLRHNRHQVGHLMNKYQNQLKLRKQIRDKINKNPRILKKHKMVVQQ